jgi:hypothetical protein
MGTRSALDAVAEKACGYVPFSTFVWEVRTCVKRKSVRNGNRLRFLGIYVLQFDDCVILLRFVMVC